MNRGAIVIGMACLTERFWQKVDKADPDECWEWQASIKQSGHGQIRKAGSPEYAHRVAYKLEVGPPGDNDVLHECGNPSCVNPSHLYLGDQADNAADMVSNSESAAGEANARSKLTEEQVRQIRNDYDPSTSFRELAEEYEVSPGTVHSVVNHNTWSHIDG